MKKTEFITFRTDKETKDFLANVAADKLWSISQLVEVIVQEWQQTQKEKADKK